MTYNPNKDYCSYSPDKVFGVIIKFACYLHDRQYRNEVKIRQSRFIADLDLWKNITIIFYENNKSKFPLGFLVGFIYFAAVRLFAKRAWVISNGPKEN